MSTPRICPRCNNFLFDHECPKCNCANNGESEPARSSEGSVTCSDLICELEAARVLLHELENDSHGSRVWGLQKWSIIEGAINKAVASERGRSQIGEHSNTPTPRP